MRKLTTIIIGLILMQSIQHLGAQSWNLSGNAGTNPATQFLGTTDNKALQIRTNNSVRLTINSSGKVGIGTTSPVFKLDVKVGSINTDSVYRIGGNTVLSLKGWENTFVGVNSGFSNTSGSYNTANGYSALFSNTTGVFNTANGHSALFSNTTGSYNAASGGYTLYSNTTGFKNTANGYSALYSNTSGNSNTANGHFSLLSNTTGFENTATGMTALLSNTIGIYNTATGYAALYRNSSGGGNSAHGYYALFSNTTGNYCTANGHSALYANTTGNYNAANGYSALYSNTTGYYNTANGVQALYSNTTGYSNTANGLNALFHNTTGSNNTANGYYALLSNTSGQQNTSIGDYSLYNTATADGNTALGYRAGNIHNNGYYNTYIGMEADANGAQYYNSIAIGNISTVTAPLQVRVGSSLMTSIGGYQNWSNLSDSRYKKNVKEDVKGIDFIMKLRPVTYNLDVSGISEKLNESRGREMPEQNKRAIAEKEKIFYSGFIAQEVEKAAKETGYDFSGVDAPKNENDLYGLRYAEFVVPLVKAVQELDENQKSEVGSRKSEVDLLRKEIEDLKSQVASLQSSLVNPGKNTGTGQQSSISYGLDKPEMNATLSEVEVFLGQNIPNPFDNSTLIPFRIPTNCKGAAIVISQSATGSIVKVIPVSGGETQLTLEAGTLAGGSYSYSLYVDGKLIETKRMELVK